MGMRFTVGLVFGEDVRRDGVDVGVQMGHIG